MGGGGQTGRSWERSRRGRAGREGRWQRREGKKGERRGRRYWEILNQNKGQRVEWKWAGKSQQLPINDVQKAAFFHKF